MLTFLRRKYANGNVHTDSLLTATSHRFAVLCKITVARNVEMHRSVETLTRVTCARSDFAIARREQIDFRRLEEMYTFRRSFKIYI